MFQVKTDIVSHLKKIYIHLVLQHHQKATTVATTQTAIRFRRCFSWAAVTKKWKIWGEKIEWLLNRTKVYYSTILVFLQLILVYLIFCGHNLNYSVPWKPKKEKGPLQIEKSKASILYDKEGRTYIDCISGVSHGKLNTLLFE